MSLSIQFLINHNLYKQHPGSNSVQHPGSSSGREEWECCRKAVQELLNLKYGKSFYKTALRYQSWIETSSPHSLGSWESQGKGAIRNPAALSSKEFSSRSEVWTPSSFGIQSLKRILDAADAIYFDCKYTYVSTRELWS